MGPDAATVAYVTSIYNAGWWVRLYAPARTPAQRDGREQAILRLGLAVREAFANSDNFEVLLLALFDSLNRKDDRPPF